MKTLSEAKHVAVGTLMLSIFSSMASAHEVTPGPTSISQDPVYHARIQNPGAPDELLIDAPDSDGGEQPIRMSVRNNMLLLQRPHNVAAGNTPPRKQRASRDTLTATSKTNINVVPFDIFRGSAPSTAAECTVDFNDPGALNLTQPSLWFDRIYLPWFQACNGGGHVDIRPLVRDHFHLGFEDPDVVPCFSNPQAYPSFMDEDQNCTFVDVPTEPREHLTTHVPYEYIRIRVLGSTGDWTTFALNQMHVPGNNAVRVCYRKDQIVDLDWLTSGAQSGTVPGVWLCWSELSPGPWDLSNWVWDVTDVKVTGADYTAGPFSLDDLHIAID